MKQCLRISAATLALCGAVSVSTSALAGPIATGENLRLIFPSATSELFKAGYDDMRITLNQGGTTPTKTNLHVRAGLFHGTADEGASSFDAKTLYRSEDDVLAYCVDVLSLLSYGHTYEVENISAGPEDNRDGVRRDFGRMFTFLGAVNTVLANNYSRSFGDKNWLNPDANTNWMSGAIQAGIWESLYEEDGKDLSLSGGWFSATDVRSAGVSFLNMAFDLVNAGGARITVPVVPEQTILARSTPDANGNKKQDLLLDPNTVPLPGTLMLLVGALAGLLLQRRRFASPH